VTVEQGQDKYPPGWKRTTLGDLGHYWNGRGFKKSEWRDSGRPIIRIQNLTGSGEDFNYFQGEADERNVVRRGDLLMSWAATLGVYEWGGPEAVLNQHIFKIESFIEKRFHRYLLESVLAALRRQTHGSGMVHITRGSFEETEVWIPDGGEQRRIVSAIEEHLSHLDAGSAEIEAADGKLTAYEQALLHAATLGLLPKRDRPRQRSFEAASDGSLPQLPVRWRWANLESIADVVGGVTKDAKKQAGSDLVEVPYLRVANVQRGRLDLREISKIRVPPGVLKKLALEDGDVLMNEGGDRDKLGRGWIWEGQIPNCIHQNHVFRVRIRDSVLEPRLLSWHGNSFGQAWFQREGKQTTNLASISLNRLKRLPVPVPPPDEQHAIIREVDRCLSVTKVIRDELGHARSRAKQLHAAILAAAFTGRLPIRPGLGQAGPMNAAAELTWTT